MRIFNDHEIDENGNVYSYKSNRYLTPHLDRYGYLYVTIAARQTNIPRSNIQYHLKNKTGEWKYV